MGVSSSELSRGSCIDFRFRWILVSALTQALALSLAEICSKYPTSAGAYYWCYRLAPPRYKLIFSWIDGWLNLVGNWTITLSVTFGIPSHVFRNHRLTRILQGTAQLIVAGAGIYHPDWVATPWQTCVFPIERLLPYSSLTRRDFPGCHRRFMRILFILQQVSAKH